MDFQSGQNAFLNLVGSFDKEALMPLLKWIKLTSEDLIRDTGGLDSADQTIQQIRCDLRTVVPLTAILPSEVITPPPSLNMSEDDGIIEEASVHVDGFLYDDDDVDELCEAGKLSRNYCIKCGSQQVEPLTFLSHSTSVTQLKYIFKFLLPNLHRQVIVDVGSRLGSVLYGGYLYSNASSIIGCEMNVDFSQIQKSVIEKYHFQDRIQVICADVRTQKEILQSADVIVMNNVFEYFLPISEQQQIWKFLRSAITRQRTLLVVSPSIEDSLKSLDTGVDVEKWLRKEDTSACLREANFLLFGSGDSDESDLNDIHLYSVL